jgi:hypothetical protein
MQRQQQELAGAPARSSQAARQRSARPSDFTNGVSAKDAAGAALRSDERAPADWTGLMLLDYLHDSPPKATLEHEF